MPGPPLPPGPLILRRRRPWDAIAPAVGGRPLSPLLIPYEWVSTPLARKPTTPINAATVTQQPGSRASSISQTSIDAYGQSSAEVTTLTACDADPQTLATFLTTYYATPRPRQPIISFNLFSRTEAEAYILVTAPLGRRVRIIHAPTGWPPGAANFTIEGIHHIGGVGQRTVAWSTAAVVGQTTTDPGPWFRWDSSSWDGTDVRPF